MIDPIELARTAVTTYIATGKMPEVSNDLPAEWKRPGAAFVCVKKAGRLRGCVGTYEPTRPSLAEEVMQNAISSATGDPRFTAVSADELASLEFSVDILDSPEQVYTVDELDPKVYGVIVQAGRRLGLLLPDLDEVDTVEQQLDIARQKAGIPPGQEMELFRFKVRRFERRGPHPPDES